MRSCPSRREQRLPLPRSFLWRVLLTLHLLVTAKIEEGLPCFKSTLTNSVECRQDVVFYCQIHGVIFAGKRSTVHGHGLFAAVPLSLSGCFLGWRWILEFCFQCWWIIFKKHVREQASYKTEDPYTCVSANIYCVRKETSCLNLVVVLCKIQVRLQSNQIKRSRR